MRLGALVPRGVDPAGFASWGEDAGLDVIACGEHVVSGDFAHQSILALAAAAAKTSRIRLMTSVVVAPLYPLPLLGKMLSYLDWISTGRLEIGLGLGGESPREYQAAMVDRRHRGKYLDEAISALRSILSGNSTDADGPLIRFDEVQVTPASVQTPHPPLWVAGRTHAAIRRAAANDAGWLPYLMNPSDIKRVRDTASGSLPIRVAAIAVMVDPSEAGDAASAMVRGFPNSKQPDKLARYAPDPDARPQQVLADYAEAGVGTLLIRTPFDGVRGWQSLRNVVGILRRERNDIVETT
jgi:alkanesulfonate monooxygenase SsuD/methylene tetrahydromethanopterin reductase-like flavin-dependent oxidoreductase (luciferase family)